MHTGVLDTVRQSCSFSNLGARPWLQPACSNHRQPCAREQRSVRVAGFGDELLDFLQGKQQAHLPTSLMAAAMLFVLI